MHVHFDSFKATYAVGDEATSKWYEASVRRLSTCSYAEDEELVSAGGGGTEKFVTQWRWFWYSNGSWSQFGEVRCFLLVFVCFAVLFRSCTISVGTPN